MYNFSFSFFFNFFTDTFCMWNLSWLNMSALTLETWQKRVNQIDHQHHLLLCFLQKPMNKLSSNNNNNNNNHHVSVVQVCVSELTTCRALILYDAYVVALAFADADVNSVFFVDQQQLAWYTHFSQTMVILVLLDVNVLFVQQCITSNQMRTHWLSYINVILIQSQGVLILNSCTSCWERSITLFLKCHHMSEHFDECCNYCKWHDHTAHCFICNNDVLIIISDDKNNDNADENEHIARLRWIASASLSAKVVVIDLDL